MFSNDQNIESIGKLIEVVKHYIGLRTEYAKLDAAEKVVRLFSVIAMMVILGLLLLLMLIYVSFALAYALTPTFGPAGAFGFIAGIYLLILVLCLIFRKKWIEQPLVKFLAGLLMN